MKKNSIYLEANFMNKSEKFLNVLLQLTVKLQNADIKKT